MITMYRIADRGAAAAGVQGRPTCIHSYIYIYIYIYTCVYIYIYIYICN